ncbi:hypothetical protein EG68_12290, partial [Paragonimus skrjabini miyazakii]
MTLGNCLSAYIFNVPVYFSTLASVSKLSCLYSFAMEEHRDALNDTCPVLSTAYYPEWWNVHTHRCNHHCRIPTDQENFGRGR